MSQIYIKNYRNADYISLSCSFIDGYLADANDAQLKVYLYLLRHSTAAEGISISALADHFNFTEKDILRALSYWEDKHLLLLERNSDGQPLSLSLHEPPAKEPDCLSAVSSSLPVPTRMVDPALIISPQTSQSSSVGYVKPDYSLEQLASFKDRESTSQLIFIAESYLGRTLSSGDIRSLLFISDELNFSFDLIDYLLQYCVDREKREFRYIEKVAVSWAESGISTPAKAQEHSSRYSKHVYTVMNALGKSSSPTPREAQYVTRWYQEYGFTIDIILEACERTVLGTDKRRFEYADKILTSWKNAGVHHKQDIAKADASFFEKKKTVSSPSSSNRFNQFQQNDYDFDALEQELLSN